ncbi:unnamed protein product [Closterium sp. NIES-53]
MHHHTLLHPLTMRMSRSRPPLHPHRARLVLPLALPFARPRLFCSKKYKQPKLPFRRQSTTTAPTPDVVDNDTTRATPSSDDGPFFRTVEEIQLKAKEQWSRNFPWLVILETSEGRPCMKCKVCIAYGDPDYQYGRNGEGGIDIQKQTMRKHHHSIKHEAAVERKELREGNETRQPSIAEFANGDAEASRLMKLPLIAHFICKSDASIAMFMSLVQFMAEMGTPDLPLKDHGAYISMYGFKQLMDTMVSFLKASQLRHIRESPYLGIQLDESTDRRRGKYMIVYITTLRQWSIVTEFYANLSVDKCDASSLFLILLTHLESNGVELAKISGISTDGASVMTGGKSGVVAQLRTRVPHLVSCHCIADREALAAKDAATSIQNLGIIDKVVRKVSDLLGRYSPKHSRFMQLQEVVTETNLEMQGIKDVRWLSRGDAIARLADVYPAVVLLLYDYDKKTYNIVTSFKFQILLYFLANVMKELNYLNLKFQRRQSRQQRSVKVEGVDSDGTPTTHTYELHEKHLKGQTSGSGLQACINFASEFAKEVVFNLTDRMKDMSSLKGARLFSQSAYPSTRARREVRLPQWLQGLRDLFKREPGDPDTLPSIHWGKAKKELWSFTSILATHHKDLSFHDSLKHMLSSDDWSTAYPNLVWLWIAVAVLPLSTVECERGFSWQNVIKSWMRSNLCDATLGELMTVSLLDYEMEPQAIMSVWHGSKKRRPAKEVVMAQAGQVEKRAKRATSLTQASAAAASKAAAAAAARAARDAEAEAAREREEVAAEEGHIPVWKRKSRGHVEEEEQEQVSEDEDEDDCSVRSSESGDDTK